MSNRDPLYGESNNNDSSESSFDSTSSGTFDDLGSMSGGSSQGSLYDSGSAGTIGQSDTGEAWNEFYDATTSEDASGTMDNVAGKAQGMLGDASGKKDEAMDKAKGMMDEGKNKAGEMAGMAQGKMDGGMTKAGESMDSAAQMLRDKGEQQGGTVGTVASTAAGAIESAGSFLQEANTGEMMDQLETYIRQNPTQSLLIAAGVGFVLAKAFK